MALDVRLVQLLGSFIGARSQYSLVRLEFAMKNARFPAPPLIGRLSDASELTLQMEWPVVEAQLDTALGYAKRLEKQRKGRTSIDEVSFDVLERALREMDQYARAIRWVMTVTEQQPEDSNGYP